MSEKNPIVDSQDDVVAFLSNGASYGKSGISVERIETHISIIFLIDDFAFKLKRAVHFPYLDYSTPTLREKFCRAELEFNRRTAPLLYRRVRAITRGADGGLAFDGQGTSIDWVVEMRRFSQSDVFDRLAETGRLSADLIRDLTDAIAAFHRTAERAPGYGGRTAIEKIIAGNTANLIGECPPLDRGQVDRLSAASMASLATVGSLLDSRRHNGKIRRCHGDLHLRNVCLVEGRPTLFDCIEFSNEFSCIDVLYDLAFLLMDLVQRGLRDLASIVFNRYLDLSDDADGLPAIPLFMSVRAAIRAHALLAQARETGVKETRGEADSYLSLATSLLYPYRSCLVAIGGLSGTGKSTIARVLAGSFLPAPGARVIRSDVLRKRLFDAAPETRLPASAYHKATTDRVYSRLYDQASASLAAGRTAIVDATFLREEERKSIAAVAERAGALFIGIWLEAPNDVLSRRLGSRRGDASDADTAVLQQQVGFDSGHIGWSRIDASGETGAVVSAARNMIEVNVGRVQLALA